MITGATLLDFYDRYDLKEYFARRIKKTLIPYIFWSLIGILFTVWYLHWKTPEDITVQYIFSGLLSGNLVDIYWFFIPLFCVYVEIPLFAAVKTEKRNTVYTLIISFFTVFNVILPFISNVFGLGIKSSFSITAGSGYLMYVMLGYLLDRNELDKKVRLTIYVLGALGLLAHIIGTYSLSIEEGYIVQTYKGYQNLPCLLYSVSIFVLGKYCGSYLLNNQIIRKIISFLSNYTYSLFLLHWFVIQMIIQQFQPNIRSIVYRLGCPALIVVVVIGVSSVIRKSRMGRFLLP